MPSSAGGCCSAKHVYFAIIIKANDGDDRYHYLTGCNQDDPRNLVTLQKASEI